MQLIPRNEKVEKRCKTKKHGKLLQTNIWTEKRRTKRKYLIASSNKKKAIVGPNSTLTVVVLYTYKITCRSNKINTTNDQYYDIISINYTQN